MPKVSVVVPVYNTEKYLVECLDSLLRQTLQDIEVVCVDDGSTDGSPQILDRYRLLDARIRVVRKQNGGLSSARNAGMQVATGDYLMFLDSDDCVSSDFCRIPYRLAKEKKMDLVSFCYSEAKDDVIGICRDIPFSAMESGSAGRSAFIRDTSVTAWTKLIDRKLLITHDIRFVESIRFGEDQLFHWQTILSAECFAHVDCSLYYYRTTPNSLTTSGNRNWFVLVDVWRLIKAELDVRGEYQAYRDVYHCGKLLMFRLAYLRIRTSLRLEWRENVLGKLDENDWDYVDVGPELPFVVRNFFRAQRGDLGSRMLFLLIQSIRAMRNRRLS